MILLHVTLQEVARVDVRPGLYYYHCGSRLQMIKVGYTAVTGDRLMASNYDQRSVRMPVDLLETGKFYAVPTQVTVK